MDFEKRLQKAINRGETTRRMQAKEKAARELSEDELRTMHSGYRLELSEHIENCLRKLADHFLGFTFSTLVSEEGWGARVVRDDLRFRDGRKENLFSRFELFIRPFSQAHIVELVAKGTVHNKEVMKQSQYQFLADFDMDTFQAMIDQRVLEFAETYASKAS
ncbi:hypothetical protein [Thalassoroseus pseudoceratinae]|uniref:hypothetical protein n=1 Tax=Thalassoroseus pseudoceratinae TaxID=2713176 RepID=UPI0014209A6B|nr:hypothetical protein [Thalassoroseus pseudoceratinae]